MFTHNIYRNIHTRVIIVKDGRILMNALWSDGTGRDPYRCLPGGGLEPNESLFECGEREALEETGLRVKVISVAFLREWIVPKCVPVVEMKKEIETWGIPADDQCPDYAYGLEVYLWAELLPNQSSDVKPKDSIGPLPEWLFLEQVEHEPLFPTELRALAKDLLEGKSHIGIPSFVTGLGSPWDKPDYEAFRSHK